MYGSKNVVLKQMAVYFAAGLIGGCAPGAYMSVKGVSNPVYVCGPSHVETLKNVVNVTSTVKGETVTANQGTSLEQHSSESSVSDSNVASEAINKATGGNDALDVQINRLSVGAYYMGFPGWTKENTWVKVKAGISENGKEKLQ